MNEFFTIKNQVYCKETVIEKSRFIAYAKGIESIDDALDFVKEIKKRHYDATHNCFAYLFDDRAKYSDDGEPQGTAGLPIFECISNKKLNRVCVVVTRYFGGVKLGAGGLVRAYSGSASMALGQADTLNFRNCVRTELIFGYNLVKTIERILQGRAIVESTVYDSCVKLQCLILAEDYDTITGIVVENTSNQVEIRPIEQLVHPFQLN